MILQQKRKRKRTLLWFTFPVHKVDDVTSLQHVSLLLDQFGHVDHGAVRATHTHTHKKIQLLLREANAEKISHVCAAVVTIVSGYGTSCLPATPALSFHLAQSCNVPPTPVCSLERTNNILQGKQSSWINHTKTK